MLNEIFVITCKENVEVGADWLKAVFMESDQEVCFREEAISLCSVGGWFHSMYGAGAGS
jgi:hypothetical protein